MKTMAIRLEDNVSAQLSVLAQLEGTTVAELIRQAIDALIETKRSNPELTAKASGVLAAIEAEASTRKQAIEALLKPGAEPESEPQPAPKGRSSRRGNGGTST